MSPAACSCMRSLRTSSGSTRRDPSASRRPCARPCSLPQRRRTSVAPGYRASVTNGTSSRCATRQPLTATDECERARRKPARPFDDIGANRRTKRPRRQLDRRLHHRRGFVELADAAQRVQHDLLFLRTLLGHLDVLPLARPTTAGELRARRRNSVRRRIQHLVEAGVQIARGARSRPRRAALAGKRAGHEHDPAFGVAPSALPPATIAVGSSSNIAQRAESHDRVGESDAIIDPAGVDAEAVRVERGFEHAPETIVIVTVGVPRARRRHRPRARTNTPGLDPEPLRLEEPAARPT